MLLRVPFQERRERQGVACEWSTEEADENNSIIMQHSKVYKLNHPRQSLGNMQIIFDETEQQCC